MRVLSTLPAFGWETANCNANDCKYNQDKHQKALNDYDAGTPARFSSPLYNGLTQAEKDAANAKGRKFIEDSKGNLHIFSNISKVIGYFPIVSIITGISRLVFAARTPSTDLPNKPKHIVRGIAEIFCLGPVLFATDLIVTIARGEKKPAKQ